MYSKDLKTLIAYPKSRKKDFLVIPDGVIEIAEKAFYYSQITNITFPDSLKKIKSKAFKHSVGLESIILKNVLVIEEEAFMKVINLKEVELGRNITYIASKAFNSIKHLNIYIALHKSIEEEFDSTWKDDYQRVVYNYAETNDEDILNFLNKKYPNIINEKHLRNFYNIGEYKYDKIHNSLEVINAEMNYITKNDLGEDEYLLFLKTKNNQVLKYILHNKNLYKYPTALNKIRKDIELSYLYLKGKGITKEIKEDFISYLQNSFQYPSVEFYDLLTKYINNNLVIAKTYRSILELNIGYYRFKEQFETKDIKYMFGFDDEDITTSINMLKRTVENNQYNKFNI